MPPRRALGKPLFFRKLRLGHRVRGLRQRHTVPRLIVAFYLGVEAEARRTASALGVRE